jgi:phosphomannomutase
VSDLSCFKAYDIRGEIGVNINEDIAYRIGRAVAQHFNAKSVVIGFDARETSPAFAAAASSGARDAGADILHIGMAGTEEMYWAVTEFGACAGIEVTASHNPINYNGMKIVKSQSRPLDDADDFQAIKVLASSQDWSSGAKMGKERDLSVEARRAYVDRVLSFVDVKILRPLKIVVNSGNGAAGPTFDALADRLLFLGAPLEFIRVHHVPDATFPIHFCRKTTLRRLMWSRLRVLILVLRLMATSIGVFSLMRQVNLCQESMSLGFWQLSFWKKSRVPRLCMTQE